MSRFPAGPAAWLERFFNLRAGDRPGPRERTALALGVALAALGARVSPRARRREAWRELCRALVAFRLFRLGGLLLREPRGPLADAIEALRARGLFRAVEGLGHERAAGEPPSAALLGDGVTASLPAGSLTARAAWLGERRCFGELFDVSAPEST